MTRKVAFWRKDNPLPKTKRTTLTPAQTDRARDRAKAAGRPYPNLVDNAAVARTAKER